MFRSQWHYDITDKMATPNHYFFFMLRNIITFALVSAFLTSFYCLHRVLLTTFCVVRYLLLRMKHPQSTIERAVKRGIPKKKVG